MQPYDNRLRAWERIARDLPMEKLEAMIQPATLGDLPEFGGRDPEGGCAEGARRGRRAGLTHRGDCADLRSSPWAGWALWAVAPSSRFAFPGGPPVNFWGKMKQGPGNGDIMTKKPGGTNTVAGAGSASCAPR